MCLRVFYSLDWPSHVRLITSNYKLIFSFSYENNHIHNYFISLLLNFTTMASEGAIYSPTSEEPYVELIEASRISKRSIQLCSATANVKCLMMYLTTN